MIYFVPKRAKKAQKWVLQIRGITRHSCGVTEKARYGWMVFHELDICFWFPLMTRQPERVFFQNDYFLGKH